MRSALILAAVASAAMGPSARRSDDDAGVTFDVPGASEEQGFLIPSGIPDGAYTVSIDDDGVAHYTPLDVPEGPGLPGWDAEDAVSEDEGNEAALVSRADWVVTCGDGRTLNKANTDWAVRILYNIAADWDPYGGLPLYVGEKLVVTRNDVVAYFCNYDNKTHLCKSWEVRSEIQERVSRTCGAYKSGWSNWRSRVSLGQQWIDHRRYYCGSFN